MEIKDIIQLICPHLFIFVYLLIMMLLPDLYFRCRDKLRDKKKEE